MCCACRRVQITKTENDCQQSFSVLFPFFFILQIAVDGAIASVAAPGDLPRLHRGGNRAAVLSRMGAFFIPAFSQIGRKFPEGLRQILQREKVKPFKIQHSKPRRVGEIPRAAAKVV